MDCFVAYASRNDGFRLAFEKKSAAMSDGNAPILSRPDQHIA
jgi:hypothetical protein